MKFVKNLCPFAVVALFLSLILAPATCVGKSDFGRTFEIVYTDENGNSFYIKITADKEQFQRFVNSWDDWENLLKEIRADGKIDSQELVDFEAETVSMIEALKNLTYDPETGLYYFPDIDIPTFVHDSLYMMGAGTRIFSIGRGRAWLPFNRQGETFIGKRFSPIFIRHTIGYTKVKSWSLIPLSQFVSDRLFTHTLFTMGFTGLFINFGKRYFDTSVGPIILIGRPRFIILSEDIP